MRVQARWGPFQITEGKKHCVNLLRSIFFDTLHLQHSIPFAGDVVFKMYAVSRTPTRGVGHAVQSCFET